MTSHQQLIYIYLRLLFLAPGLLLHRSSAEVEIATFYNPPYLPCYGRNKSNFPLNNLFAAAGEGIWDNGAACGRVYRVRSLSSPRLKNACDLGSIFVHVKIVDRAATSVSHPSNPRAALVLHVNAFKMVATPAAS